MDERRRALASTYDSVHRKTTEALANPSIGLLEADEHLKELRQASEALILCDIVFAKQRVVETGLWTAHSRVNVLFRKQLALLRKQGLIKPVELHKFIKLYLTFLKQAQRSYRQLIQCLNATYGVIPELQQIAQLDATSPKLCESDASPEIRRETLLSCHRSLIYLGDLSRYRAAEHLDKEPAWGPAVGYYTLAATLRPSSGMAYHQLSVIALEENDHLKAVYYLYRGIVAEEPHPNAIFNLELEFKKVRRAWESGAGLPRPSSRDPQAQRKIMIAWFVRMHSIAFQGKKTPAYTELENEVQSHLLRHVKAQSSDSAVQKMCFVNFAAQQTAAAQFEEQPGNHDHMQSYFFFLGNNLKTMTTFLNCLVLDLPSGNIANPTPTLAEALTSLVQSILPSLRLYSAWLLTNAKILTSRIGDEQLQIEIVDFWTVYANAMTLLSRVFPVRDLPNVNYLLPEDVESFDFIPIRSQNSNRLWYDDDSKTKLPKCTDVGDRRLDASDEALARIRGLLIDALLLAYRDHDPLTFDGAKFALNSDILHSSARRPQQAPRPPPGLSKQVAHKPTTLDPTTVVPSPQRELDNVRRMSEMVDDLVGEDKEDYSLSNRHQADTLARRLSALNTTPSLPRSGSADSAQRMQSVSSLWGYESPMQPPTPQYDGPNPRRTSGQASHGHSRVNSAASLHSVSSGQVAALASSFVPTPPPHLGRISTDHGPSMMPNSAGYDSGMNSPLLFGTGGVWSTRPRRSIYNETPPNGQGG